MIATNPKFDWWRHAGQSLEDLGVGLANAPTIGSAFGVATRQQAAQQPQRDNAARIKAEDEERKRQIAEQAANRAKYADMFAEHGAAPILVDMVRAGDANPAEVYWDIFAPKPAADPTASVGGRAQLAQAHGLQGEEAKTYILTGKLPERGSASAPSGYQPTPDGTGLMPTPGGPADPNNPLNRRKMNPPPNSTVQKEILETDESIDAGQNVLRSLDRALQLNKVSKSGYGADFLSSVGANIPDWVPIVGGDTTDVNTQELKNIVTAQALESLKATFGAAPTEGERKILLEVQGSVDQPAPVREAIFKRAKAAAQRRLDFNRQKVESLRGGDYFTEGGGPGFGEPDDITDLLNKYEQ